MPDPNAGVLGKYRRLARVYDWATRKAPIERLRARQFELAGIRPEDRVLVVGVGTGLDLPHLPSTAAVTGIDVSAAMLRRARGRAARHGWSLRQMSAERLDFPERSFDFVIMNCVLSIVDDPQAVLTEAARILPSGGSVWILGKFSESRPSPTRRALSWVTTTIGGADLTRSLDRALDGTPLQLNYREEHALADIIQLVRR